MTGIGRSTWIACGLAATALYFSAALWLKHSYVEPPRPTGERVIRLVRPFFELLGSNNRVFSVKVPELESLSDTMDQPTRSPFLLYEGMRPLGPPHSDHVEILEIRPRPVLTLESIRIHFFKQRWDESPI